jgi:hypothetical protein
VSWLDLTAKAVGKHFPESIEAQKEHTKKKRQNVRSTKQKLAVEDTADVELTQTIAKQNILVKVINAHEMVYSDQTGWLPVQSNGGNWLLMVHYDDNANYINAEPMKDHKDNSMIRAYQELWAQTTCNKKKA